MIHPHQRAAPAPIEDYALIGDCQTAALVAKDGSIDWLCLPRFDSGACFAALLGTPENGRWCIAPSGPIRSVRRRYRPGTLILETVFETADGEVALIDFMPPRTEAPDLMRIVEARRGSVPMRMDLTIRFDYGSIVPWVRSTPSGLSAIAGPDRVALRTDVPLHGEALHTVAEFTVAPGQPASFELVWHEPHRPEPEGRDPAAALDGTEHWWREWSSRCPGEGEWTEAVERSLITLKAMTYAPTGGLVAAATTSLPEQPRGVRNWDYRFCWLRDATFTLMGLLQAGYRDEARAWRDWLLRSVAGEPSKLHIMYGLAGERRLTELELDWLPGYQGARPVRTGNLAWRQFQLDVYGEVIDAIHQGQRAGNTLGDDGWRVVSAMLRFLEEGWRQPDEGIWEVRGPRQHFTHSQVMAWVAFDRGIRLAQAMRRDAPIDRWKAIRAAIHERACREGYNPARGAFVQALGSRTLDASLLMIPLVGFLPPNDPRVLGTIEAIQRELMDNGYVRRYQTDTAIDGLPPGEGGFLLCTFWLADALALSGRFDQAKAIFERLLSLRNDVGLLSEMVDPATDRFLGNFPQAFSHTALINTAFNLRHAASGPAPTRSDPGAAGTVS